MNIDDDIIRRITRYKQDISKIDMKIKQVKKSVLYHESKIKNGKELLKKLNTDMNKCIGEKEYLEFQLFKKKSGIDFSAINQEKFSRLVEENKNSLYQIQSENVLESGNKTEIGSNEIIEDADDTTAEES